MTRSLLPSRIMSFRMSLTLFACLSSGAIALAQAPASTQQAAAAAKDPQIGQIITQLEAVRAPHQTALSPDGQWIAWVVNGKERGSEIDAAPLTNPSATHRITACGEGEKGSENEIAWSPDSHHLAFFSNCNSDHQQGLYLAGSGIKHCGP